MTGMSYTFTGSYNKTSGYASGVSRANVFTNDIYKQSNYTRVQIGTSTTGLVYSNTSFMKNYCNLTVYIGKNLTNPRVFNNASRKNTPNTSTSSGGHTVY